MFNPKLDMTDSEDKRAATSDWKFKKPRQDPMWVVAKALGIIGIAGFLIWLYVHDAFAAKVCVTVSESRSSVQAQHTILFKRNC